MCGQCVPIHLLTAWVPHPAALRQCHRCPEPSPPWVGNLLRETERAVWLLIRGGLRDRHLCSGRGEGATPPAHIWLQARADLRDEVIWVRLSHATPSVGLKARPPDTSSGAQGRQLPPALSHLSAPWSYLRPVPSPTPTWLLLSPPAYPAAHFRQRSSP